MVAQAHASIYSEKAGRERAYVLESTLPNDSPISVLAQTLALHLRVLQSCDSRDLCDQKPQRIFARNTFFT